MGLDMYLTGERTLFHGFDANHQRIGERFFLGYWRKHPDLHGYLVETFAEGIDECQPIPLTDDNIRQIIGAIERDELPKTSGFFFGTSTGDEKGNDLAIFRDALTWLDVPETDAFRSLTYQASW